MLNFVKSSKSVTNRFSPSQRKGSTEDQQNCSTHFKHKVELLREHNVKISQRSIRRKRKHNFPTSLKILIKKKQPVRLQYTAAEEQKDSRNRSPSRMTPELQSRMTSESQSIKKNELSLHCSPNNQRQQEVSLFETGNKVKKVLTKSNKIMERSLNFNPKAVQAKISELHSSEIGIEVYKNTATSAKNSKTQKQPKQAIKTNYSIKESSLMQSKQHSKTASREISTEGTQQATNSSARLTRKQNLARSPTKTMILTLAESGMTNKSSMAQLKNTFHRLDSLLGKKREERDESMLSSTKLSFLNQSSREMLMAQDSDGFQLIQGSDSLQNRQEKISMEEQVKQIRERRLKPATAPHIDTAKQLSVAHSEFSNELDQSCSNNQQDLKLHTPARTKRAMTHMEKLKEIQTRIKLDLSNAKIKKKHFAILSTSMSQLSSKLKMQQFQRQSSTAGGLMNKSGPLFSKSRNLTNRADAHFLTKFEDSEAHMKYLESQREIKTVQSSQSKESLVSSKNLLRQMTKEEATRKEMLAEMKEAKNSLLRTATAVKNYSPKLRQSCMGVNQSSMRQLLHVARNLDKPKQPSSLIDLEKPIPCSKTYVLDMKACLSKAKKKRGLANDSLERKLGMTERQDSLKSHLQKNQIKAQETVHDTSYKLYESFQLILDRKDPSYRNWMKDRLKKVNEQENIVMEKSEDAFLDQYFVNIDPNLNSSKQQVVEMTKPKTLVGPGYYNINHSCNETLAPSFTFDQGATKMFNEQRQENFMQEKKEIAMNRAARQRREKIKQPRYRERNQKEQILSELVGIVEDGGQLDREDAELLIVKIKEEHKQVMAPKLKKDQKGKIQSLVVSRSVAQQRTQSTMSRVPRWGALTFEEKVENDMVINRMKDCDQQPHNTDFLKLNIRRACKKQSESSPNKNSFSPYRDKAKENSKERELKVSQDRDQLIKKLNSKEKRRIESQRLGQQQKAVKESFLELYTLNAFLHAVAETYLNRYSLQHKKDAFSRRAMLLFWVIGKFKMKARNVRVRLADTKVKQVILQWVRRWRAKRHEKMKNEILSFMEERVTKVNAFLRTAQVIYSHVVHIQRAFRRSLRRKRFIMVVYSMSWIVAEKRYLAQLKKSEQLAKDEIRRMSIDELFKIQHTSVPLRVRLFYVNQYQDMVRQAYKKQYADFDLKRKQFEQKLIKQKSRLHMQTETIEEFTRNKLKSLAFQKEEEPIFQTYIDKTDLVQMIIDALRFRVKWPEIEQGIFFNSPALKRISKLWYERVGLHYVNINMEDQNHRVVQVKIQKAEKQGRVRRNAIRIEGKFPDENLSHFIQTRKLPLDLPISRPSLKKVTKVQMN